MRNPSHFRVSRTRSAGRDGLLLLVMGIVFATVTSVGCVTSRARNLENTADGLPKKLGIVYLRATEATSSHSFRPLRYYKENELKQHNNKVLLEFVSQQEKQQAKQNTQSMTKLLQQTIKKLAPQTEKDGMGLSDEDSDSFQSFGQVSSRSGVSATQNNQMLQSLLLALEQQSAEEQKLMRSGVTSFAKSQTVSHATETIRAWIKVSLKRGTLSEESADALSLFVKKHEAANANKHILARCPLKLLSKLAAESLSTLKSTSEADSDARTSSETDTEEEED